MVSALVFTVKKEKCIHRFAASDTIPGIDHDNLILDCNKDPYCPKKLKGALILCTDTRNGPEECHKALACLQNARIHFVHVPTDDLVGRAVVLYEPKRDMAHRGIIEIERYIRSQRKSKKKNKKVK